MVRSRPGGIPGPAGEIYCLFPLASPPCSYGYGGDGAREKVDARLFVGGAWEAMLEAEQMEPYGNMKMSMSVASFKNMVLREGEGRAGRITVRAMAKEFIGKDARVVLGDITGVIFSTVHSEVFSAIGERIEVGSVLVLRNIAGLLCLGSASVHLSVLLSTIDKVYVSSCSPTHKNPRAVLTMGDLQWLKDSYSKEALDFERISPKFIPEKQIRSLTYLSRRYLGSSAGRCRGTGPSAFRIGRTCSTINSPKVRLVQICAVFPDRESSSMFKNFV